MKSLNARGGSWPRLRSVLVFLGVTMVILSIVNVFRSQAMLDRLQGMQSFDRYQQYDSTQSLYMLEEASSNTQLSKNDDSHSIDHSRLSASTKQHQLPTAAVHGRPVLSKSQSIDSRIHNSTTASSSTTTKISNRPVYFLQKRHLNLPHDAFSATFWQSKERFLGISLDPIKSVEGAIFEQLRHRTKSGKLSHRLMHEIRMTVDWLDFSVEHLSKWWRTVDYDRGPSPIAYHTLVHKLLHYTQTFGRATTMSHSDAMSKTLAVVAYMPYESKWKPSWGQVLTVVNVAATVASLTRHGIGRIVVVGEDTSERRTSQALVQAAFRLVNLLVSSTSGLDKDWEQIISQLIQQEEERLQSNLQADMKIGDSSVTFANVNVTYSWIIEGTNTTNYMTLVPKAALDHLQQALRGEAPNPDIWLGSGKTPDDYHYVYLTEPDTILQMRPSAVESLRQEMDKGHFLAPHRFQPAPHETDLLGYKDNRAWIPNYGIMSNVTAIRSDSDACCDDGIHRPKDDFPRCSSNWWACGYTQDILSHEDRVTKHERVHPYALIRLGDPGTNLVLHAATNHGRRCIPQTNTHCPPPA